MRRDPASRSPGTSPGAPCTGTSPGAPCACSPGTSPGAPSPSPGRVALVGAGPGDPDLLTVRAARLLSAADVVLVDALVDPRCLALCKPTARIHDVGKLSFALPGEGGLKQDDITARLVAEARTGAFVVRLKGGDPFVFGRGGEEALACAEAGIDVEVVPGLSSALTVPALANIPVTHRGAATSFTVLTGTSRSGTSDAVEDAWRNAARAGGTLVFLMSVNAIERIVDVITDAGRSPTTPAAIIERGACADAKVLVTTLADLGREARLARVMSPAVIVIGDVVNVRGAWARLRAEAERLPDGLEALKQERDDVSL